MKTCLSLLILQICFASEGKERKESAQKERRMRATKDVYGNDIAIQANYCCQSR